MKIHTQCSNHFHHGLVTRLRTRRERLVKAFASQTGILCQLCHATSTSHSLHRHKKGVGIRVFQCCSQIGGNGHFVVEVISNVKWCEIGHGITPWTMCSPCLLYTSDAADDLLCVDLGGRRI